MKKATTIILAILVLFAGSSFAQKSKNPWLKTGTSLTYNIKTSGQIYDFIITGLKISGNIYFDWKMTNASALTGSIDISKDALDTATVSVNYFNDGALTLTDKITVWTSKKVYNAVKKKKTLKIDLGKGKTNLNFKGKEKYTVSIDGKDVSLNVLYAETERADKLWILDDASNPLILKMNLGWVVELKTVTTQ